MRKALIQQIAVLAAAGALLAGCASSGNAGASPAAGAKASGSTGASGSPSATSSGSPDPTGSSDGASSSSTDDGGSDRFSSVVDSCKDAPTNIKNPNLTWPSEPAMSINTSKNYTMTLHTNCGDIVIKMNAAKTPHTVNSFKFLASKNYFNGSFCYGMSTSADPKSLWCGDATVGPDRKDTDGLGTPGYSLADENLAGATYPAGTVAMINKYTPNTNGSQFFLVYADSQIPPKYTPFGFVTQGLDILKKVADAGISEGTAYQINGGTLGAPNQPVELESVSVTAS